MDPIVIFGMVMAFILATIMICALDSETKSIRRAGVNEFEVGREYITKPVGRIDKQYDYVYATCNSDRWPCGAVLIVSKAIKSYGLNNYYVFVHYDERRSGNPYSCGIFKYTPQSWGNGFATNLNHSTCIGQVVGIRVGGINQFF